MGTKRGYSVRHDVTEIEMQSIIVRAIGQYVWKDGAGQRSLDSDTANKVALEAIDWLLS